MRQKKTVKIDPQQVCRRRKQPKMEIIKSLKKRKSEGDDRKQRDTKNENEGKEKTHGRTHARTHTRTHTHTLLSKLDKTAPIFTPRGFTRNKTMKRRAKIPRKKKKNPFLNELCSVQTRQKKRQLQTIECTPQTTKNTTHHYSHPTRKILPVKACGIFFLFSNVLFFFTPSSPAPPAPPKKASKQRKYYLSYVNAVYNDSNKTR